MAVPGQSGLGINYCARDSQPDPGVAINGPADPSAPALQGMLLYPPRLSGWALLETPTTAKWLRTLAALPIDRRHTDPWTAGVELVLSAATMRLTGLL